MADAINAGEKWQKSIYPATGVVYGGKWGDKTPFTAIYKAYTPFSITTLLGPLIKRAKRFIDVYGGGAEGGNVLPLLGGTFGSYLAYIGL